MLRRRKYRGQPTPAGRVAGTTIVITARVQYLVHSFKLHCSFCLVFSTYILKHQKLILSQNDKLVSHLWTAHRCIHTWGPIPTTGSRML